MHTVINHLPIRADADWPEVARKFDGFAVGPKQSWPGVNAAQLPRAGEAEAIVVVTCADFATLQEVSLKIAAPWLAENIRPDLAGPVARSVGEMVAGCA